MEIRKITYYDKDVVLEATVAIPQGGQKKPLVMIFPSWEGKNAFAEKKATELAKLGFIGCALDPYGIGKLGKNKEECSLLMGPLIENRENLHRRVLASLSLFQKISEADIEKVAVIGFCFGGLCALDLAREGALLKGVVSFHGLLSTPFKNSSTPFHSKVLVLHGDKDPMVSKEDVASFCAEMEERSVDFQVHVFGNTMHAFTNPEANDPDFGTVYNELADKRSWILLKAFLEEIF